jgi:G3E family GTPase
MLPICLVTGFLGAGKTTFLKHIVSRNRNRKIIYLVNEFSAHDVDGAIVSAENPNVVSIPGGSIFCKCLVTEFMGQLTRIAAEQGEADGVVIEASGMANPNVIEEMLSETGLDDRFRLTRIVSVIDPNSFLKLRYTLPNILAQVEAADAVLINKTDCNSPESVKEADSVVQELNPNATRIQTVQCDVEIDLFAKHAPRGLHGEYAKCRDPNYATFVTEIAFSGDALERFVLAHAEEIYRVKGTLAGEFFDYSSSGVCRTLQPMANPGLAWIVQGGSEETLRAALKAVEVATRNGIPRKPVNDAP